MEMHEVETMVKAFEAGRKESEECNVVGNYFLGGFNVADNLFNREKREWKFAVQGAMAHISQFEVFTKDDGRGAVITRLEPKA